MKTDADTKTAQDHQIEQLLLFLSKELGREVVEAEICDDQHDPAKLRFKVCYGPLDEPSEIEVDYSKLRDHMVAARAAHSAAPAASEEPPPPPQFSRAMTLVKGEQGAENAKRVIAALSGMDFQAEDFGDDARRAVDALGLNLVVTHGPPANVGVDVWVTQLAVRSVDMTDTTAGCSFTWGAIDATPEAALDLLKFAVAYTHV